VKENDDVTATEDEIANAILPVPETKEAVSTIAKFPLASETTTLFGWTWRGASSNVLFVVRLSKKMSFGP
jgi:hypothetical protein